MGPPPRPNPRRSVRLGVVETLPLLRPELPLSCPFRCPGEKLRSPPHPHEYWGVPVAGVGMFGSLNHPADPRRAGPAPGSPFQLPAPGQVGPRCCWGCRGGKKKQKRHGGSPSLEEASVSLSPGGRLRLHQGLRIVRGGSILLFQVGSSWSLGGLELLCPGLKRQA